MRWAPSTAFTHVLLHSVHCNALSNCFHHELFLLFQQSHPEIDIATGSVTPTPTTPTTPLGTTPPSLDSTECI